MEVNLGGLPKQQSKLTDTDRYKRYFFTTRVFQVRVNTMQRVFEQRSELQVTLCLSVQYCRVSLKSFAFSSEMKLSSVALDFLCRQPYCTLSVLGI